MGEGIWQRAVDYLQGLGYSGSDSQAIVGNLWYESGGLNTNAVGDSGLAYGIAQWHPDRQAMFEKVFGKSIEGSTLEEQLSFVDWELNNTEISAKNALLGSGTIADKVKAFMTKFERVANMSSLGARVDAAGNPQTGGGSTVGSAVTGAIDGLTGGWGTTISQLFSGELVARIVVVVIGVILVGIAIAAFTLTSDTGKQVIASIKPS